MLEGSPPSELARQARQAFADQLANAMPRLLEIVVEASHQLLDKPAERAVVQQRRDNLQALLAHGADWTQQFADLLRGGVAGDFSPTTIAGELSASINGATTQQLQLVDDETVQRGIFTSRLAQGIADEAVWEYNDLQTRIAWLEDRPEIADNDLFRPSQIAKLANKAFMASQLPTDAWAGMEQALRLQLSAMATEGYHDANRFLIERGVMPEVNLRTLIRRSVGGGGASAAAAAQQTLPGGMATPGATPAEPVRTTTTGALGPAGTDAGGEAAGFSATQGGAGQTVRGSGTSFGVHTGPGTVSAGHPFVGGGELTMERFGRTMERHVRGFMVTERHREPSPALVGAMAQAQREFPGRVEARQQQQPGPVGPVELAEVLQDQKQTLKNVAATPAERATIEIVAMMFQAILTEERIPAMVRVWFARLQMPVLRVAVSEPDFFSSVQHPARRLIDRMGACVMGFDAAPEGAGEALEAEVVRIVQVVEAFPETGRKVFQTVLVEFERFLERYFRDQNETTKKGISLAQQVEQRETMAIQYTIELRRLLDGVPVQDGVRDFLFQVWADVLATAAMRSGPQGDETRAIRETALELVWIAGAKTTREERAEVIRRLGPLLAALRKGMMSGGQPADKQESALRALNASLTAAFAARGAAIDPGQLTRLKSRLEALDEILPDADFEIDDSFALDLSGHESDDLEVVSDGGQVPSAASLAATDEMQVGGWYMLEYRDRHEPVQLAWQGLRRQLSLFVSTRGRCVLFQRRRLAGFLQARLLTPAQKESLTIAATRSVIEKINANPGRLR